jgi:phospholipase/carboxylesterase
VQSVSLGKLRCVVAGATAPRLVVWLCHGFGAPGDDLVGLYDPLIDCQSSLVETVQFVFPEAPHDLSEMGMPDSRAWWRMNLMQLQRLFQLQSFDELYDMTPPGLDEARQALLLAIHSHREQLGLPAAATVLGGFSQGAMLTTDVVLRSGETWGGLVALSGALICRPEWSRSTARLADVPILQSHGQTDQVLPFASGRALADLLKTGNPAAEFMPFPGPHTITYPVLQRLADWLLERVTSAAT